MNKIITELIVLSAVSGCFSNQAWSASTKLGIEATTTAINKGAPVRDELYTGAQISHEEMEKNRLQRQQVEFPKRYRLSRFMDTLWASSAELTIEKDGNYEFLLADGRSGSQLRGLTRNEAINLWGKPASHYIHIVPYTTFSLQTLIDDEPAIYHVDMEFANEPTIVLGAEPFAQEIPNLKPKSGCMKFRLRGPGITEEAFKATGTDK